MAALINRDDAEFVPEAVELVAKSLRGLRPAGNEYERLTVAASEKIQFDTHCPPAARRASQASTACAIRLAAWRR